MKGTFESLFRCAALLLLVLTLTCHVPSSCRAVVSGAPLPTRNQGTEPNPPIAPSTGVPSSGPSGPSVWTPILRQALTSRNLHGRMAKKLTQVYSQSGWTPLFIGPDLRLNRPGQEFLRRLQTLTDEGMDPASFPLQELSDCLDRLHTIRSRGPTRMSIAGHHPLYAMRSGPMSVPPQAPPQIDSAQQQPLRIAARLDALILASLIKWSSIMDPFAQFEGIQTLRRYSSMKEYLDSLEPTLGGYRELRQAYRHYRTLALAPVLPPLKIKRSLRPGARGEAVRILQMHLAREGYFQGTLTDVYDPATIAAVKAYQHHHLLVADGIVGRKTAGWINMSLAAKAELLKTSLQAMRRSRSRIYKRYLRINIPQFELQYYRDGRLIEQHRIIVGRARGRRKKIGNRWVGENHTPSLVSRIRQIIFNPRWYVPERIRLELDRKIEEEPEYLDDNGFVAMESSYSTGEPRIYQRPGPFNPLGRVKFEFPNRYSIYLHDTSQRHLFRRIRRDFSHGCVRVDKALELARRLLEDDHHPAAARIGEFMKQKRSIYISLKKPVPIVIEYIPVVVDNQGKLVFCGDIYGRIFRHKGRGFPM